MGYVIFLYYYLSLNCALGICVCGFEAMGNPKSQRVEKEVVVYVLPRGN